jgi:hypothetical protein
VRNKQDPTWWSHAVIVPVEEFSLWQWPSRCVVCLEPATERLDVAARTVLISRVESLPTVRTTYSGEVTLPPHSIPYCSAHLEQARKVGDQLVNPVPVWVHEFPGSAGVQRLGLHMSLLGALPDASLGRQIWGLRVRAEFSNGDYAVELVRANLPRFIGLDRSGFSGETLQSEWYPAVPMLGKVGGADGASGIMQLLRGVAPAEGLIDISLTSAFSSTGLGKIGLVAYAALLEIGPPAWNSVVEALTDPHPSVRRFAVRVLALMPDLEGLTQLARTASEDPDRSVRAMAVQALVERYSTDPAALEALELVAAGDPDRSVSKKAEKFLKRTRRSSRGR